MKELVRLEFKEPLGVMTALKQNWSEKQKVMTRLLQVKSLHRGLETELEALDKEHTELMNKLMEF